MKLANNPNFKYKTSFSSKIRCVVSKDKSPLLSEASIQNLKSLIPNNFINEIDLLAISFNACTPNLANLNGDVIDTSTAKEIYNKFISRPINIEHDRAAGAIGHIISAGFSKFNENYLENKGSEIIQSSDIKDKNPFNISLAGVLYKAYCPNLIDYVEESADPNSEKYMEISASWELLYNDYVLAVGSKYLKECEIINDPTEIAKLEKNLLSNGGSGQLEDGRPIFQLIVGEIQPMGVALTNNPAGAVAGLATLDNKDSNANINNNLNADVEYIIKKSSVKLNGFTDNVAKKDGNIENSKESISKKLINAGVCPDCGQESDNCQECDDNMIECGSCNKISSADKWKKSNISSNLDSQSKVNDVKISESKNNIIIKTPMKLNSIKDLTDENLKEVKAAADLVALFDNEIKRISDEYVGKLNSEKDDIKNAQSKYQELETKFANLEKSNSEVIKQLNDLAEANKLKEAEEIFSNRMLSFDEKYDLTKEDREIVGDMIKGLDKEKFDSVAKKLDTLLASKVKKAKEVIASTVTEVVNTKEVLSTAIDNGQKTEQTIPVTTAPSESLADKMKRNFGQTKNWFATKPRK